MAEAVAAAISYIASGTTAYASSYMVAAYAVVIAAPPGYGSAMHKRAQQGVCS